MHTSSLIKHSIKKCLIPVLLFYWIGLQIEKEMPPAKSTVFIYIWIEREAVFSTLLASHFSSSCLSIFLFMCFPPHFSVTPTPHSPASPRAFIFPGCFLYENTPIGRQAPLSDTIHFTCIDMKSVLTSTTAFCGAAETAYQWQIVCPN